MAAECFPTTFLCQRCSATGQCQCESEEWYTLCCTARRLFQLPQFSYVRLINNGANQAIYISNIGIFFFLTCSASRWNLNLSYNVHLNLCDTHNPGCANPSINDQALFFYALLPEAFFSLLTTDRQSRPANYTITSRQVVTNSLNLNNVKWSRLDPQMENILMCEPQVISTITTAEVTTESERTTNPMEELLTTTHETTRISTTTEVPTTPEATTINSTAKVPRTEGTLSSTAVPEKDRMTEAGTTELEPTTSVIQTLQFSIDLAVIGSRKGLSSQLQFLILVCNLNMYTHIKSH